MNEKINIGIADDHLLVRNGFASILNRFKDIDILFEAGNGKELLDCLRKFNVSIILLDIEMPVLDGSDVMPILKKEFPNLKIIVVSAHSEPTAIINYVKLGAVSFLAKEDCDKEKLLKAIYSVNKTGSYFDRVTIDLLSQNGALPVLPIKERKLSSNERTVLEYICKGKSFNEIAELMGISVNTVRYHKRIISIKTQCQDIESLILHSEKK